MINRSTLTTLTVTYLAGISIGWFLEPDQIPADSPVSSNLKSTRSSNTHLTGQYELKLLRDDTLQDNRNIIEKLSKAGEKDKKLNSLIDEIEAHQVPDLLRQLSNSNSLAGLSSSDKKVFQQLLKHWYSLSKTETLSWLSKLPNEQERVYQISELISLTSETNLDEAIELMQEYLRQEDGSLNTPLNILNSSAERSAELLFEVSIMGQSETISNGMNGLSYPDGFDFKKALNLFSEYSSSLSVKQASSITPSNLLSEWAAINPQDAYDWLNLGKSLIANDSLKPYIEGYVQYATPVEVGTFLGDIFDAKKPDYSGIKQALHNTRDSSVLETFLNNSGSSISRNEHYVNLLHEMDVASNYMSETRHTLLRSIPAEQRLAIIGDPKLSRYVSSPFLNSEARKSLIQLGHSTEQIDRIFNVNSLKKVAVN